MLHFRRTSSIVATGWAATSQCDMPNAWSWAKCVSVHQAFATSQLSAAGEVIIIALSLHIGGIRLLIVQESALASADASLKSLAESSNSKKSYGKDEDQTADLVREASLELRHRACLACGSFDLALKNAQQVNWSLAESETHTAIQIQLWGLKDLHAKWDLVCRRTSPWAREDAVTITTLMQTGQLVSALLPVWVMLVWYATATCLLLGLQGRGGQQQYRCPVGMRLIQLPSGRSACCAWAGQDERKEMAVAVILHETDCLLLHARAVMPEICAGVWEYQKGRGGYTHCTWTRPAGRCCTYVWWARPGYLANEGVRHFGAVSNISSRDLVILAGCALLCLAFQRVLAQ